MLPKHNEIKSLINEIFKSYPSSIKKIGKGVHSSGYAIKLNNNQYCLRLSSTNKGFIRDQIIASRHKSLGIPIPQTIKLGKKDDFYYSLTELCLGKPFSFLNPSLQERHFSEFLENSYKLHSASFTGKFGYGNVNDDGLGNYASWQDFNLGEIRKFENLINSSFGLNSMILINYINMLPGSYDHLLHGDFGYNNFMIDSGKITGIIDWSDAMYGDFVYDIAYASFWSNNTDYEKLFFNFYSSKSNLNLDNYRVRLNLYTILIGAKILNYFLQQADKRGESFVRQKIFTYQKIHGILQN